MKPIRIIAALLLTTSLGCETRKPPPLGTAKASSAAALTVDSTGGCTIDEECASGLFCFQGHCGSECDQTRPCAAAESCSTRGRCIVPAPAGTVVTVPESTTPAVPVHEESLPDVQLVGAPDTVRYITAGQAEATFTLEFTADLPAAGFAWAVDRDDDPSAVLHLQRATAVGRTVNLSVTTGVADPSSSAPRPVKLTLITPFGRFAAALVPARPADGTYVGSAVFTAFGGRGLPLQLQLVTEPPHVPIELATAAYLVLPVSEEALFSPLRAGSVQVTHVTRPLVFDAFVNRWVAVFDHAFDLTGQTLLTPQSATQVRRTLRFEVEPFGNDQLIGAFKDTWTGLYEQRTVAGVASLPSIIFEGTLELQRFKAPEANSALLPPVATAAASPQTLPAPPLDECGGATAFSVTGCSGITSPSTFMAAAADAKATCAVALTDAALAGPTTAGAIRAYLDDNIPDPPNGSFSEFLDQCAAQTNGTCVPTPAVACARQALGAAFRERTGDTVLGDSVMASFQKVAREVSLGRSLAAFSNDMRLRKTWLQRTDFPAVVTSEVKQLNAQLLQDWQVKVLDVHFDVLHQALDRSGLAVMTRDAIASSAVDNRQQLLLELMQTWRGSIDALTLGAHRWNVLYQDATSRSDRTRYVSRKMLELYLSAGLLKNLNLSAGAGYLSAGLAGGFAELQRETSQLALPFNKLVYARDAEVVTNTSVDPSASNETLLKDRREAALADLTRAQDSMTLILTQIQAEALQETQLRNRMSNELNDLRSDLIELCGLPVGCTLQQAITDDACQPRTEPGKCGFAVSSVDGGILPFASTQNVSQAGRVLLDILSANQGVQIARAELDAQVSRTGLMNVETTAFAAEINRWADKRRDYITRLTANLARQTDLRDKTLQATLAASAAKAAARQESITGFRASVESWNKLRLGSADYESGLLIASTTARTTANTINAAAESVRIWSEAAAVAIPKGIDDFFGPARLSVYMVRNGATTLLQAGAQAAIISADSLDAARDRHQLYEQARWANTADTNALEGMVDQDTLTKIDEELKNNTTLNQAKIDDLAATAELLKQDLEATLTIERDASELRRRQTDLLKEMTQIAALELRVVQANTAVDQKVAEYLGLVQRGELINAKVNELRRQQAIVNSLVGSPAAIFGQANRLSQAEQRLELAKASLMEFLVALEYLAVRPFMDQRLQILLASNTYQLEKIANDLVRLQNACGGAVNTIRTELSVRKDLLGITQPLLDPVTQTQLSPEQRFRTLLTRGGVPVDKRIRYKADSTIGRLLERTGDVLSATFSLSFRDFANLDTSCNAKVRSIDVQLVGPLGTARPTVSLLYDGASQLRSCQPGIDEYVSLFGPESTAYGSTTLLRAAGRSVSPVAGINAFPTGSGNLSLGGLPLVSQYTLLIDTKAGENTRIDWSQLEDVVVRFEYSYQDVFPVGRCQ